MAVIADEEGGGGVIFRFFFYKSTVDDFGLIEFVDFRKMMKTSSETVPDGDGTRTCKQQRRNGSASFCWGCENFGNACSRGY
jgi:hypothetical protein